MRKMHRKSNEGRGVLRAVGIVLSLATLAGCSVNPLHKMTGDVMSSYAKQHNTPYVLAMTDVKMACALGESVDPLLYSFGRVTQTPEKTGVLMQGLSGICGEMDAVAEELRYLRAEYHGNIPEMRDARENMQREYAVTAERRLDGYRRMLRGFNYDPEPGAACPTFYTDQDEITFLIGLASGAQALMNDGKSRGRANVPRDIASQVERSADCVSNEKWAGLPDALRASVWVLLPDLRPSDNVDPWRVLAESRELSVEMGIRMAAALEVVMAENVGREDVIRESLAHLAETREQFNVNPQYSMPDRASMMAIKGVSDRLWTKRYGYRTPADKFGSLSPESETSEDSVDTEGLL